MTRKDNAGLGERRAGTEKENRERLYPNSMATDSFSTCLGYFLALLVSARETMGPQEHNNEKLGQSH